MSIQSILSMSIVFLISGCTVNGKSLTQMMDKNSSNATTEQRSDPEGLKFNFKWANKEYHDGEEDININVNH